LAGLLRRQQLDRRGGAQRPGRRLRRWRTFCRARCCWRPTRRRC
jgi:hypothetical protein